MEKKLTQMDLDYEHILKLDYDKEFKISYVPKDSFIYSDSRDLIKLDGVWNFAIDVYDTFIRKRFFDEKVADEKGRALPVDFSFDSWEEIRVPGHWNLEKPEYYFYEGSGIYTRKFLYSVKNDKKVILKIGASNYETRVWLNKKLIARHVGGYTPFCVDITDDIKEENRIIVMVNNTRKVENVPSLNFDWFNFGGIFRSIEVIDVPKEFIKESFFYLKNDGKNNKISYEIVIEGNKNKKSKIEIEIPELKIKKEIIGHCGKITGEILVENLQLWCPENPKLYKIIVRNEEDEIEDKVGFRTVEVKGTEVFFNGKKIFLKGICNHEETEKNGRALTEEEMIETIKICKELGCNFIRNTHYPHSEKISKLADEMGIMLWEEIPVYWALDFDNEETKHSAYSQLEELIRRDRNRASVIIWSIGNENPDTDSRLEFMKGLSKIVRELDPSRLISAACLVNIDSMVIEDRLIDYIDIVGINEYYGWYYREYGNFVKIFDNSKILKKPVLISETGAEAIPKHHGSFVELYTEECQELMYKTQFEMIDKYDYIVGISPWILADYRTQVRINHYQKGYNLKGILDRDRKHKKLAYKVVQEYYKIKN